MNPVKLDIASQIAGIQMPKPAGETKRPDGESFDSVLKGFVNDVNELQHKAADVEGKFLTGEISDVHEVMLASEEASIAFELLMEIRNKLVESYKEIIRTPA